MNRREILQTIATAILLSSGWLKTSFGARAAEAVRPVTRSRPGDPSWPSPSDWARLRDKLGDRLIDVRSPIAACRTDPSTSDCAELFKELKNPYYLGDEIGLTQTLGWVDAWTSQSSVAAVAARTTQDIAVAVDFARDHDLRLVVKGGGHSYQGTSNAADSLLVWTRAMNAVTLDDAFVGAGCSGRQQPTPAVTVEAGATWGKVYDVVTTKGGRYVQGGGCLTVGVAGLVQTGGFGSFSKRFGTAAANLLEAEIVTADGAVRTVNACQDPDLFWAIKGGGGGSFGVVTRLTLRTHDMPSVVGAVFATIEASSDAAFKRLVGRIVDFYARTLFDSHWGEQIAFRPNNTLNISMVFQDLDQQRASEIWRPFFDWISGAPADYTLVRAPVILAAPTRHFWDPAFLRTIPGLVLSDGRPGAPEDHIFWASNLNEAGQVLHGYQSVWLPASLLRDDQRDHLAEALFAGSRHWSVALHVNKGLAGAPADTIAAVRQTAMNPAVLDAFTLVICGAGGPPAYPGIPGHEPDVVAARQHAQAIESAMSVIRRAGSAGGSYLGEGNFFDATWRDDFWGDNYAKLLAVKDVVDPDGLFVVHHGVGSERWSADGFTRLP